MKEMIASGQARPTRYQVTSCHCHSADWVASVKVENRRQVRPMKQLLKYERFKTTNDGT
jgi:hypothetical protein